MIMIKIVVTIIIIIMGEMALDCVLICMSMSLSNFSFLGHLFLTRVRMKMFTSDGLLHPITLQ